MALFVVAAHTHLLGPVRLFSPKGLADAGKDTRLERIQRAAWVRIPPALPSQVGLANVAASGVGHVGAWLLGGRLGEGCFVDWLLELAC